MVEHYLATGARTVYAGDPRIHGICTLCACGGALDWGEPERAPYSRSLHRGFVVSVCPRAVCPCAVRVMSALDTVYPIQRVYGSYISNNVT